MDSSQTAGITTYNEALPSTLLQGSEKDKSVHGSVNVDQDTDADAESQVYSTPTSPLGQRLARVLCLLAMGTSSVERILDHTFDEDHDWKEFKKTLFDRIANVNVVSSLILATTAAFLTTNPPTGIGQWDKPMPYVTLLLSFCLGYISAGSGVFLIFVLADVQGANLRELMKTPWKFWLAMLLLATPVLFVGMAGGTAIIALCGAIWLGDSTPAKVVLTTTLTLTVTVVSSFLLVVA